MLSHDIESQNKTHIYEIMYMYVISFREIVHIHHDVNTYIFRRKFWNLPLYGHEIISTIRLRTH